MMARRTGGTHKGVEEKRRSLPIYHHYTLSPGKTKSHHPEAKCNHCQKEFVCGSKQRLIRHLRKCSHISNPEQIIAETLNTLARNSATGQLNHSILEASNLLPSQFPHHMQHHHHNHPHHQQQQQIGQHAPSTSSTITTANINNSNSNNNNNSTNNVSNHNTSGSSSNDTALIACTSTSNGSQQPYNQPQTTLANVTPAKRPQRRGRKPANQTVASSSPSIHVTTGLDGKTRFTPASQIPPDASGSVGTSLIAHNSRQVNYAYHQANVSATPNQTGIGESVLSAAHHHPMLYKLNSDPIDKAYLKLTLTRNLPLSLSDTKEFQLWIKSFATEYKPPSSINLIAQNLKQEAQIARQRVSNILVKAPKKTINLELHSWPEKSRGHSWYGIVAAIDHKRFLVSTRDVNVQQYSDNSSTTNTTNNHNSVRIGSVKFLSEFIDDCIKRVGSDRINSLVFSDVNEIQARRYLNATHPSIVTYSCWWHFTNLLCSDIIEHNETFKNVIRNSNSLINFVNSRPRLSQNLEKFCPFFGLTGSFCPKKNERRWYSHLVCYLLEYIKNNNDAIVRALETYSLTQSHLSSDNNNNNNNNNNPSQTGDSSHVTQTTNSSTQQQQQQATTCHDDAQLIEFNSIVMSSDYWTNLNLVLAYLKPIQEIVALTSTVSTHSNGSNSINHNNINSNNNSNNGNNSNNSAEQHPTPSILPVIANSLSLSDYMCWFLNYGKTLIESWNQSPDHYKYALIGRYLSKFSCEISNLKLLFAAYLLNPKHRCAFITQKAKNVAIEEILTIASEFIPEETDGHTIFDQWKLYLIREEPYDVLYEEGRSTPLEWWMSLPCAESIRRVALRILRLKAFTSPKPESLFSQLYFYEDETKSSLSSGTFEDLAVLKYFYDYEDKVGQLLHSSQHNHHNSVNNTVSGPITSNGCYDRGHAGLVHGQLEHDSTKLLPSGCIESVPETNGGQTFSDTTFSNVVVEFYMNHHHNEIGLDDTRGDLSIKDLPGYELFSKYIDYNETGVQIVEEPIGKKKRKWTAQEILSKCQSNQ